MGRRKEAVKSREGAEGSDGSRSGWPVHSTASVTVLFEESDQMTDISNKTNSLLTVYGRFSDLFVCCQYV